MSAVPAETDELCSDEVSGGIYGRINQNPIYVKENPSWFTWQDYETVFACVQPLSYDENDFTLHKGNSALKLLAFSWGDPGPGFSLNTSSKYGILRVPTYDPGLTEEG